MNIVNFVIDVVGHMPYDVCTSWTPIQIWDLFFVQKMYTSSEFCLATKFSSLVTLLKGLIAMSTMSPQQQQLNRIFPKMVKLIVQEEVDEERKIIDDPRMLRRKVGGNYGKGFSFNKRRRTLQVAMTRYVGGRQIGKRLPGPLSKSSLESRASSRREVRDKVQSKESLEPQVDTGVNKKPL